MHIYDVAPTAAGFALALHGGAGGRIEELSLDEKGGYTEGLAAAYSKGQRVLAAGGAALDAVCASVEELENNALFNAGHGAALTATGEAELDASVMSGDGRAGAVAVTLHAKNPVRAAQKVMEETEHVLLVAPNRELLQSWDLETVERDYFLTPARQAQLMRVRSAQLAASRHGTVGAVAIDRRGRVAAATSTGGMVNQSLGRVGDSPIIGAGTYARDGVVAISCTGHGESFIRGVVAYDIAARIRYLKSSLHDAVAATFAEELTAHDATGGLVAVGGDGRILVAHNSPAMFAAFDDERGLVTLT